MGFSRSSQAMKGRAPKARTCFICGRPTLLPGFDNHVIQCRALFEKREAQKPPKERRSCPQDPMLNEYCAGVSGKFASSDAYLDQANAAAQNAWESTLSVCRNCNRSFLPEKLPIHQRSCTAANPARRIDSSRGFNGLEAGADRQGDAAVGQSRSAKGMPAIDPVNDFPTYGHLIKCASCGRNFNEVSYAKHSRICRKVFSSKRKVFDSAKARAKGTELADFMDMKRRTGNKGRSIVSSMSSNAASAKLSATTNAMYERPSPSGAVPRGNGMPKWKAQSLDFRKAIRMARQVSAAEQQSKATGVPLHTILNNNSKYNSYATSMADEQAMGYIRCSTCGRSFNQKAGERHIPQCKNIINKPTALRGHSGAPAYSLNESPVHANRQAARPPMSREPIPLARDFGMDQPVRRPSMGNAYSTTRSNGYESSPFGSSGRVQSGGVQRPQQAAVNMVPGSGYGDRRGSKDMSVSSARSETLRPSVGGRIGGAGMGSTGLGQGQGQTRGAFSAQSSSAIVNRAGSAPRNRRLY